MYDLAIIGAGAAGIEAAAHALRRRLHTVLIEKNRESFGGVCLNRGCVPTKFYLARSSMGSGPGDLFREKNALVKQIRDAACAAMEKQGVDILWGQARFLDRNRISVDGREISAGNILIATGSRPRSPVAVDNKKVFFAEDIFSFDALPERICIVGGGCIGMEFACIFNNLGKKVTVIEKEKGILAGFEPRVVRRLQTLLEREGIEIRLSSVLEKDEYDNYDMILVAAGREPVTGDLGLEQAGVKTVPGGRIEVDRFMRTAAETVFACGDAASEKMYAYTAEYQARCCIETIAGEETACEYTGIPECVYTIPQLARVGLSEQEAAAEGITVQTRDTYFMKFSSAHVYGDTKGYMKVITDGDDVIVGAVVLSIRAAELISLFSLAVREKMPLRALREAVFPHPTLSEIIPAFLRS